MMKENKPKLVPQTAGKKPKSALREAVAEPTNIFKIAPLDWKVGLMAGGVLLSIHPSGWSIVFSAAGAKKVAAELIRQANQCEKRGK
jgi:hypothetical protein